MPLIRYGTTTSKRSNGNQGRADEQGIGKNPESYPRTTHEGRLGRAVAHQLPALPIPQIKEAKVACKCHTSMYNVGMAKTRAQYAEEAIQVQDACNPSGVAHLLSRYFNDTVFEGTQQKCEDPIVRMIVCKLEDLCGGGDSGVYVTAWNACKKLAKEGDE